MYILGNMIRKEKKKRRNREGGIVHLRGYCYPPSLCCCPVIVLIPPKGPVLQLSWAFIVPLLVLLDMKCKCSIVYHLIVIYLGDVIHRIISSYPFSGTFAQPWLLWKRALLKLLDGDSFTTPKWHLADFISKPEGASSDIGQKVSFCTVLQSASGPSQERLLRPEKASLVFSDRLVETQKNGLI